MGHNLSIHYILYYIREMLSEFNSDDFIKSKASDMFTNDKEEFEKIAEQWTSDFAM